VLQYRTRPYFGTRKTFVKKKGNYKSGLPGSTQGEGAGHTLQQPHPMADRRHVAVRFDFRESKSLFQLGRSIHPIHPRRPTTKWRSSQQSSRIFFSLSRSANILESSKKWKKYLDLNPGLSTFASSDILDTYHIVRPDRSLVKTCSLFVWLINYNYKKFIK